ncbi:MAG: DUF4956 domain-containing protein [Acidobacteria bacterium]|nr:DUF4956 domain-containing protein [Acidobacteriota bacterium]
MPDFFTSVFSAPTIAPAAIGARLVGALVLGAVVAWIYRHSRDVLDGSPTFPATLVLLAVLIAMVTQVIGDNVARAFSLVGALSIVRFRTVVRDTQDTAFVIFAVVVGMAVGAGAPWVAAIGLVVVGGASFMMRPAVMTASPSLRFVLTLRVALGLDMDTLLGNALDDSLQSRQLQSIGTTRQGTSMDVVYDVALQPSCSPDELVATLYRLEGIHAVELRRTPEPDA